MYTRFVVTRLCFWADACALTQNTILIHPAYANDTPLRVHELVHAEQMRHTGAIGFWFQYLLSRAFRQKVEVEAYKAQIAAGASAITCASHLTRYWLGITQSEALALLEDSER